LAQMLERIVEHADLYTQRIEQRLLRKAQKAVYLSAKGAVKAAPLSRSPVVAVDESTLHWVGLVTA
jgi:hypothetical protein